MEYFWYWMFYAFLGYCLEKLFARATRSARQVRRNFIVMPFCAVYGCAMVTILLTGAERVESLGRLMLLGMVFATAVEYLVHWFYDTVFGVAFWDYTGTPFHVEGRVCLPFSVAWGLLSALAVRRVQPVLAALAARLPDALAELLLFALALDAIFTARILLLYRDTELLSLRALLQRKRTA